MIRSFFLFLTLFCINSVNSQTLSKTFTNYSICTLINDLETNCKDMSGSVGYMGVTVNPFSTIKLIQKNTEVITHVWDNSRIISNSDPDFILYNFLNAYGDVANEKGTSSIIIMLSRNYTPLALIQTTNINGEVIQVVNK